MIRPSKRVIEPSHPCIINSKLIPSRKGISRRIVLCSTAIGVIAAESPRMIRMFIILLPTIFPMVMSAFPFNAAEMLTAASGALVPMATMVKPIISWGIFNFSAIAEAPSRNAVPEKMPPTQTSLHL